MKSKLKDYIINNFFNHQALKVIDFKEYLNILPNNIELPEENNEYPVDWLRKMLKF